MAGKTNYLAVQKKDGTWTIKSSKTRRTTIVYYSKAEVWKETKRLARGAGSVATLRGKDGEVMNQNTYEFYDISEHELSAR